MHLTRAADYAVRLMVHLAGRPAGSRQTLSEIAKAVDGPEQFLSKVLQQLVRAQLLASHRAAGEVLNWRYRRRKCRCCG